LPRPPRPGIAETVLIGITLFVAIITVLDWLGRKKDRQSRNRAA
jgi:hypothetical protein